ncbi:YobI family P-loop NTPase [Clostridium sp.]|uniref:YobI family P-loop NTPase n=1 Tax=Clostridium sp. TaxID=1506 RepID=UPI002FDD8F76
MNIILKIKDKFHNVKAKFKRLIYNLIEKTIQGLNRFNIKHMQNIIINDNKYKYEDLMPKIDIHKNRQYCETLEWALKNYNIKNIALTGVYGSGKSTILKTFEALHKEYKYLNISMATFNDGKEKNKETTENKKTKTEDEEDIDKKKIGTASIDNAIIEKGILQQMFYKVKYKSIPSSRFKRIKDYKFRNILFKLLIMLSSIFFGIMLCNPAIFTNLSNNVLYVQKNFKVNSTIIYICEILLFIAILKMLTPTIKYLSNGFRVTKISTKAGEAQLDDSEKSIFNKYIDEILYFFEMTKYDVVVFQDLDRFNNIEIFSKLRELNLLINNCEQINRSVAFIYAIKDDIFSNDENKDDKFHYKNRTKFFDFIIPVVQVANSSNACNLMIKKFDEAGLLEEISEEFISEISFLINDRRVLNNIFNEYVIYKENLKHIDEQEQNNKDNNQYENKLDPTKLLSIIVYKNMYPVDFAKLQDDEGMVYKLFSNKDKLIESTITQLKEDSKNIEIKIEYAEKEYMEKVSELRIVYGNYILETVNRDTISIHGCCYNYKDLFSQVGFNAFLNYEDYKIQHNFPYNSGYQKIEQTLLDKLKEKKEEYLQREHIVKLKEANVKPNVLEHLKKELDTKHKEINLLNSKPLKDSINDDNKDEFFKGDISSADLLKFLIREGHIDESYPEYISYFYEGVLTPRDNEFIHNVMYEKEMEFGRSLDKPKNIMKKIHEYRFTKKYILNYNLLDFIIENKNGTNKYEDRYKLIIEQLSDDINVNKNFLFIKGYIDRQNHLDIFVKSLCNAWPGMWNYIEIQSNLTKEKKNLYLKYIFEFANNVDVIEMNKEGTLLAEYISKLSEFIELMNNESKFEKTEELLKELCVRFECLKPNKYYDNELFKFIVENDLYEINIHMIELIANHIFHGIPEKLYTSNYTTILESSYDNLIRYIDKKINTYIENVFLALDNNRNESKETMINILKREDILIENKQAMVKKENTIFSDINEIEDINLWPTIIKNEKIEISWYNIITYYNQFNDDQGIFTKYLNNREIYIQLSQELINSDSKELSEPSLMEFSKALILNNALTKTCFNKIVKSIPYSKIQIMLESIEPERIDIIIDYGVIGLSKDNYNNLKQHFSDKHLLLLKKNINEYLDNLNEYNLDSKDIINILNDSIDVDKKVSIINNMNIALVDNDIQLINSIVDFTLNNKHLELKYGLLPKVINSSIEEEKKINILINQIDFIDEETTFKFLNLISNDYSNLSEINNEVTIEYNKYNKKLAETLKNKDYISDFNLKDNENIKINTKSNIEN